MSFRRYEILLPIKYNDGTAVERRKFLQTYREIVSEFGGIGFQGITHGVWVHEGHTFKDTHRRVVVDVEDTPENETFFFQFKQTLKERFQQVDIWIISYEIRVT